MWNSRYVKIGAVKWRISMKSYSHLEHDAIQMFECEWVYVLVWICANVRVKWVY